MRRRSSLPGSDRPVPSRHCTTIHTITSSSRRDGRSLRSRLRGNARACAGSPYVEASPQCAPQVVGYKYVRIYGSDQTHRVYPLDGERCNTSRIDLDEFERTLEAGVRPEAGAHRHQHGGVEPTDRPRPECFSLFEDAPFWQGVIGPGDGLYIPRHAYGTRHLVPERQSRKERA